MTYYELLGIGSSTGSSTQARRDENTINSAIEGIGLAKRIETRFIINERGSWWNRTLVDEFGPISAKTTPLHTFDF